MLTAAAAGFSFVPNSTDYVASIDIAKGVITTKTKTTGAATEPVMTRAPTQVNTTAPINWTCTTTVPATMSKYVPAECR